MLDNILLDESQAVFGEDEYMYQCVLDDFEHTHFIGIMTYNISPKRDSLLLKKLKTACTSGTEAIIFTNIPKRFPSYFNTTCALAAKNMIDIYKCQLNPQNYGMKLSPYFTFHNHAKIIMTDNYVYWGSSNFSDESSQNFECGTISRDKKLISYLKDTLFQNIKENSVSYYKHNFAIAIANIDSIIPICEKARQNLYEAAFEPIMEYDTNFEEKWVYGKTYSGITTKFLNEFTESISRFDDALDVINDIVNDDYALDEEFPQVDELEKLYEEYKYIFFEFNDTINLFFENLKEMAGYDVTNEANSILENTYLMVAYDENFEYYAEKAMDEAQEKYEEIIDEAKETVYSALEKFDTVIECFKKIKDELKQLLEINSKIDNTMIYERLYE